MSDEDAANQFAREAVAFLSDFEELSREEKLGAIEHASSALDNARREL